MQACLTEQLQQGDIVEWVIEQIGGPISITQTSFSIAEEYLRRLVLLKSKHYIRRIEILLDMKATTKTLSLVPMLRKVADEVHLTANHSKVVLIANDRDCVSIITSQNLTRGNRYESTIITTSKDIYSSLFAQINLMLERESYSLTDLINGKVNSPQHSKEDNG